MDNSSFNADQKDALRALLERFGSSLESFLDLRADTYEHALARQSVEHLEQYYAACMTPGLKPEEIREFCPPWPKGTSRAGTLPGTTTISSTAERLRTEGALNSLSYASSFMEKLRTKAAASPVAPSGEVLDALVNFLGQEVLDAKLQGMRVGQNLEELDRLITVQIAKDNGAREDVKLKLKKVEADRKQEELSLEQQRFMRETCELFLKWYADKSAKEIANSPSSHSEKLDLLGQLMFPTIWKKKS